LKLASDLEGLEAQEKSASLAYQTEAKKLSQQRKKAAPKLAQSGHKCHAKPGHASAVVLKWL